MGLMVSQTPMQILRRFSYTEPENANRPDAIKWQSGALVEAVTLFDQASGSLFDATLDESINGAVEPQMIGRMTFEHTVEQKPITTRSGRDAVAPKHKFRLVKVEPVEPAKAAKP
jgi:hypothetical protein